MFNSNPFAWLRPTREAPVAESTWNPGSLEMQEPRRMGVPPGQSVVTEQPRIGEPMLQLRGGGEGEDVCCGLCAGVSCFECFSCCDCCCDCCDCCGGGGGPGGPPGP
ncbi:uncharacterized protein BO97DRAFT_409078 [Aspergillus homomorphus CBS 101889]|uniref:Cysteine-rich transmembrane CYSTM domain-containing protein n=1 Tax=Aspergillus homomorphus (strain CBS 101889) TaxID=1450537 RepID=A0A395HHR8_ASPHC|nr:hypothetical protein BO97DRAFT_409078 [Aspergillus homomorphus CBS 101889]RAL07357.1 hypothetical protein BO97DRAFT_409078 [Aspergillus homomorphus CBS 101889]